MTALEQRYYVDYKKVLNLVDTLQIVVFGKFVIMDNALKTQKNVLTGAVRGALVLTFQHLASSLWERMQHAA